MDKAKETPSLKAEQVSVPAVWPARRLVFVFTHPTIGDSAGMAQCCAVAMAEYLAWYERAEAESSKVMSWAELSAIKAAEGPFVAFNGVTVQWHNPGIADDDAGEFADVAAILDAKPFSYSAPSHEAEQITAADLDAEAREFEGAKP